MLNYELEYDEIDPSEYEGESCPNYLCAGRMAIYVENCTCFLNPSCDSCMNSRLRCNKCGWEFGFIVLKEEHVFNLFNFDFLEI